MLEFIHPVAYHTRVYTYMYTVQIAFTTPLVKVLVLTATSILLHMYAAHYHYSVVTHGIGSHPMCT